MSTDYFKRVSLANLYPPFRELVETLQANCLARGAQYYATSAYRSVEEQNGLYALGRTKPNVDATDEKPLGNVVTKARGGQSFHNHAVAIDFALDKDTKREGLQPNWSPEAYKILAEEAVKLGLEAGANWTSFKDYPHIQLNISKAGLGLADLQKAQNNGGLPAVFALLNRYRW